jgi:cytochrome d ubiquinol oxidase subunit II
LANAFRVRALGSGVVAGAIALGGIAVLHEYAHPLYHGLVEGSGLPALIVSAVAGAATLGMVWLRRFEPARYTAALAVAAIVAGWALAQSPNLLPGLTVKQAAAPHDTQVAVVVAILAGAALLAPSLATLFRLALGGRLGEGEPAIEPRAGVAAQPVSPGRLVRVAAALLIAGLGLVNVANAEWAHVIGAACFVCFIATAFRVAVPLE